MAAVYLLLPQIPMLFMGEEWGAAQPFPFFCDFGPELADAVRQGRREEFARFPEFQDPAMRERIPDPTAEETFAAAKLDWEDIERAPHAGWLDWYRRVLAIRARRDRAASPGDPGRRPVRGARRRRGRRALADRRRRDAGIGREPGSHADPGFPAEPGRVLWQEGEAGR